MGVLHRLGSKVVDDPQVYSIKIQNVNFTVKILHIYIYHLMHDYDIKINQHENRVVHENISLTTEY